MNPVIYAGTAGWSYKDWVPNFYPQAQSVKFDWLKFYSQYFNCVEVNASYYTYLNTKIVENWIEKVEEIPDFLFTVKLHQDFTHSRNIDKAKIASVTGNLNILQKVERFGGLLLQFPYSFVCSDSNIQYLSELFNIFDTFPKFAELRHSSWNNQKISELFSSCDVSLCTIDQPEIGKSIKYEPVVINDTAYLRFHGRNVTGWQKSIKNIGKKQTYEEQSSRYEYFYSPGELHEIGIKIKEVYDNVKKIYVIMNNHPTGYAVANAFEMLHILNSGKKINIPETVLNAFPRLKNIR
ncbi:MAG: DUF72 domain-containing protein [Ignavibacteria bacterium]|nr:DUF72 domain-containing protein [Ignavibacteria bacterium]